MVNLTAEGISGDGDSIQFGIEFPPFEGDGVVESETDSTIYRPWVVEELEEEQDVQGSSTRDQCGRVERQNIGTDGKKIRVVGFIKDVGGPTALTKDMYRERLYTTAEVRMVSNLYSGRIEVQNAIIGQNVENKRTGGEDALIFPFQLQLGEPEREGGGF